MKKSVKLALRARKIRCEINGLDPGEDTPAKGPGEAAARRRNGI